jgi:hypothetical protein
LNFTHFDVEALQWLSLDPQVIKTWGPKEWAFALVLFGLVASFLLDIFVVYKQLEILTRYLVWGALFVGFIRWNTKRQAAYGKELHIHHYELAMFIMSFITAQSPLDTIVHGFFHGMMIEGTCRWGIDPTWAKPEPPNPDDPTAVSRKSAHLLRLKQAEVRKVNKAETSCKVPRNDVMVQENAMYMPASIQYVYPADQEVASEVCVEGKAMMYGTKVVMQAESSNASQKQLPSELLALLTPANKASLNK